MEIEQSLLELGEIQMWVDSTPLFPKVNLRNLVMENNVHKIYLKL